MHHYQRDGAMAGASGCPVTGHLQGSQVNFYPDDRSKEGAPVPKPDVAEPPMPIEENAWLKAYDTTDEDNYSQAGNLFRMMSEEQKVQLAENIAGGLSQATDSVQQRMIEHFTRCDDDYGRRVAEAVKKQG
ncbi:MAG: catalase-related domain-containing protein [Endozoicomonas sp.]|uniref:catalase-related domain-containing protein n=1 Tax=Endozoicomonas sp. TaxID=1892382 RepID=UPI003D9B6646